MEYAGRQPNSDPPNIVDVHSPALYEFGNEPWQCLVITFHRISIRPTALAIQSGPLTRKTRRLTSYVFQRFDTGRGGWVLLDERHSVLEFLPGYAFRLSHIDTNMVFSVFRLLQTDSAVAPGTHCSINALELHGTIRVREEAAAPVRGVAPPEEFDPWAVPDFE
jgi:hypothetical protein